MGGKKKISLQINCEEISEMEKSIYSEIGSDGLRFLKQDLHIGPDGLMHINGEHISALLQTTKQNFATESQLVLGRGSACVVQEGIYKPLNKRVAIKTINIYDQNKRHQIMNDIRVLLDNLIQQQRRGYSCSSIVTLYGAYYDEGKVKVILELMDVGSLDNIFELIRAAKIEPEIDETVAAKIALQILCGLSYLHKHNQVHRDVKPANILINTAGEVKLSDFGISREFIQGSQFSKTSIGTRSYMSPERIEGQTYGYKSDIWGLGLIMYELATGIFPYKSKNQIDLRNDFHEIGTPNLPKTYSLQFNSFIGCCLAIEDRNRASSFELLSHPWIMRNIGRRPTVGGWIDKLRKIILPIIKQE